MELQHLCIICIYIFHFRRDSGLSRVLGSMTKLFSKNIARSTDLLFLKSLVGSNNRICHERAILVSCLHIYITYPVRSYQFENFSNNNILRDKLVFCKSDLICNFYSFFVARITYYFSVICN